MWREGEALSSTPLLNVDPSANDVLAALLDGWERNNLVLHNSLRILPPGGLEARATPTGPTVGQMFTHLCHERLVSVEENAAEHAGPRPNEEWGVPMDLESLHALLDVSARHVCEAVVARTTGGRAFDRSFAHPVQLIQFLIFHEAYHHGQVKLALKVAGTPLTDDVTGPMTWDVWRAR